VFWASLSRGERRTLAAMVSAVAGLHVLGFVVLLAFVAPSHDHLGKAGALTIGIGVTAYTLGLRHAFDADHIAAIDNTTRKFVLEGEAAFGANGRRARPPQLVLLGRGDELRVTAASPGTRYLLMAGPARRGGTGVQRAVRGFGPGQACQR
jgi:High-affinity nickel-transport protein